MEQAPQGTFEDELDWCIRQLETGLFRFNPTPNRVTDTQRILKILRSKKAPFVKKRQVMSQVFGNYRDKIAKERRAQEKSANNPSEVQIQEGASGESHSLVYRKSSKDKTDSAVPWFTVSNSSFAFNFCPDQSKENEPEDAEKMQLKEVKCKDLNISKTHNALCTGEGTGFTFDFQIPEDSDSPSLSSDSRVSTQDTSGDQLNLNHTSSAVPETSSQNSPNALDSSSIPEMAANQTVDLQVAGEIAPDSPKKKKKKKKTKHQSAQTQKVEEPQGDAGTSSSPKEVPQTGADELRRELDWCVEQLRIGLQRQKSTPKQVEEALRAIKTLSGEKVPLVKKRQVMRAMFGDYRRKMEEERLKQLKLMQAAAKSARVSKVMAATRQNSSKVFRKSKHKSSIGQCNSGQSNINPAGSQVSCDPPTAPGTSNREAFIFQASQKPFCFNFF